MACGLPIVDIEFLTASANMKRRGTMNHQRYPFPGDDEQKRGRKQDNGGHLVLGASNYTWDAPKKARTAALDRHSLWQREEGPHGKSETLLPGTDLLFGYRVVLLGEFDQPNHSKRTVAKRRKQRDSVSKGGGYCTRGNLSLLLQLSGATLYDIEPLVASRQIKRGLNEKQMTDIRNALPLGASESGPTLHDAIHSKGCQSKVIVMVKDKSDVKLGHDFNKLLAKDAMSPIPIVSCQWLLDSIGEFEAKEPDLDAA